MNNRESSFELLRIVAQWMIVIYHLLYFFIYPMTGEIWCKAAWIPLHTGVILYVLISGYFGIHPSIRALARLLAIVFVYTVPLALFGSYVNNHDLKEELLGLFFVSRTPFWFVRTYLYLYLLSPIINKAFEDPKLTNYLLIVLVFICIYVGTIGNDPSLRGGKNILNFTFFYVIGHELRIRKGSWMQWAPSKVFTCYILINFIVVVAWYLLRESLSGIIIWDLSYPYQSPLLLLNAVVLFVLFGHMKFESRTVNFIASSSFSVYLIHSHPVVKDNVLDPICSDIIRNFSSVPLFLITIVISLIVMIIALLIDKCLMFPFYFFLGKICRAGVN